jgi:diaminohydroxyphosphoribosylaminopyrimidine deaminase/5-amino-6-(5-phosphoribosylamino)uracil reductase
MSAQQQQLDLRLMRRALRLAMQGRGLVEPNPMVGCVVATADGRVVGEGYHRVFGAPHAEPDALAHCSESPVGATVYVTLEPCCHTNKKTPPCVPALLAAKPARVVAACVDPDPNVAGEGIQQLRAAGIRVDVGVLEAEARQLNAAFFAKVLHRRAYVTLKWAQSADRRVAGPHGQQVWISNDLSRRTVHELRARCDAILVGINTVTTDDPLLTARGVEHARPLLRIVLDSDLRLPLGSRLVRTSEEAPVLVLCSEDALKSRPAAAASLAAHGVQIAPLPLVQPGRLSLSALLEELGTRPISHLLVEPGPTLAAGFMEQGAADRVWVFHSPKPIVNDTAPLAARVTYPATTQTDLDGDRLTEYLNPDSAVFFALTPSADICRLPGTK